MPTPQRTGNVRFAGKNQGTYVSHGSMHTKEFRPYRHGASNATLLARTRQAIADAGGEPKPYELEPYTLSRDYAYD